jgi:WD40 repeat protein
MSNNISKGNEANAFGDNSISIGDNSLAENINNISIGHQAQATGDNSIYIGVMSNHSESQGNNSISIGDSITSSNYAISIGYKSNSSSSNNSISIGDQSNSNGENSIAIGYKSYTENTNSIAIGDDSNCNSDNSIAMGYHVTIANDSSNSVCIGDGSTVNSSNSVSMGYSTICNGDNSVCIGDDSSVNVNKSIGIGHECTVNTNNNIILGNSVEKNCDIIYTGIINTKTPGFPSHISNDNLVEGQIMMLKNRLAIAKKNNDDEVKWHYVTLYESNIISKVSATDPEITNSDKFTLTNTLQCWNKPNYPTGQGILVGLIDGGVPHNHPDFSGNFLKITPPDKDGETNFDLEIDDDGTIISHGTKVASVISSKRLMFNETNYDYDISESERKNTHGYAFNATLADIASSSDRNKVNTAGVRYTNSNAKIICNSWGNSIYLDSVTWSIDFYSTKAIFNDDSTQILTSNSNGQIYLWNIGDPNLLVQIYKNTEDAGGNTIIQGHTDSINDISFSSDGSYIFSVSDDSRLIIWNTVTGTSTVIDEPGRNIQKITVSSDDLKIITSDLDGKINIYTFNGVSGEYEITKNNLQTSDTNDNIFSITFHSSNAYFITGSADKLVKLWDTDGNLAQELEEKHTDNVTECLFNSDDSLIFSCSLDKTIAIYEYVVDVGYNFLTQISENIDSKIYSMDLSSNDLLLVIGCEDHSVKLWGRENTVDAFEFVSTTADGDPYTETVLSVKLSEINVEETLTPCILSCSLDSQIYITLLDDDGTSMPFESHRSYFSSGNHYINGYLTDENSFPVYVEPWFNDTNNEIINVFASGNEAYTEPCITGCFPAFYNVTWIDGDNTYNISLIGSYHIIDHWLNVTGCDKDGKEYLRTNRAGRTQEYSICAMAVDVNLCHFSEKNQNTDGTSFSAPAVCGGLALIMENFPELTPAQCVSRLLKTASYDKLSFGTHYTILNDVLDDFDEVESYGLLTIYKNTNDGESTNFTENGFDIDKANALLPFLTEDESTTYLVSKIRLLEIIKDIILGDNYNTNGFNTKGGKFYNDDNVYQFDLETRTLQPFYNYINYTTLETNLGSTEATNIFKGIYGYGLMDLDTAMQSIDASDITDLDTFLTERRNNVFTFSERTLTL